MIRIILIEDNRLLRDGLKGVINSQKDMMIVDCSGEDDEILKIVKRSKPDIILIDLSLRNRSSQNLVKQIRKTYSELKIIIMDLIPSQSDIYEFIQEGVRGFILKEATVSDFLKTVRSVAKGIQVLPPDLTSTLFTQITDLAIKKTNPKLYMQSIIMTRREKQVITLIAEGLSNKEIADRIHLSTYTVKSHVHNILEKLALRSRVQIANYANKASLNE